MFLWKQDMTTKNRTCIKSCFFVDVGQDNKTKHLLSVVCIEARHDNREYNMHRISLKLDCRHKHTKPPKNSNHKYIFLQLLFFVMYGHHILDYICDKIILVTKFEKIAYMLQN